MSNRSLAWIPGLAAFACASIMAYLTVQIDQTRQQLENDGVLEFNFVQQIDHNFDAFAQVLMEYQVADDALRQELMEKAILSYDILYGSVRNVADGWLGSLRDLDDTRQLLIDANDFLDQHEMLMNANTQLEQSQAMQINEAAIALSTRVYDLGLEMFARKTSLRDNIARRMDDLYDALWVFGISFILASMMTIALLIAIFRREDSLRADAAKTQTRLTTALDELNTGDIERQAQNRFMASASHDLRQPLHALGLYLNALKRHVTTDQGQIILANIFRSTEALSQLLNSMLDLSKLDAGVVDVNPENLNLDMIFDHLHQTFLPEANQRELALDIRYNGLHVRSDRVLLERILGNLVSNALHYTQIGHIRLCASEQDGQVCITITDTGPGIPLHEQEAIFNEYYQLHNPKRDRSKGLGLGLSIVKRLTRLLGISLSIQSEVDRGTTFELRLPKADKTPSGARSRHSAQKETPAGDYLTGLSILVIDDEPEVRDGMRTLLEQNGCDVALADSAKQACDYIISNSWVPEMILADYRLRNEMTGDMAIEQVREEVNLDVPAMIITGDTSPARLREAAASGFPLLHKPVIANELLNAITRLIGDGK